ncbi:MAG: hypothetical protein HY579_06010 [Nitrospinae bacterium]|nr:hypothetical protein [Nitrospinota bacterium]
MSKFVKAYEGDKDRTVVYEYADKTGIIKNGGTISWRHNNPGNIESTEFPKGHDGIGSVWRFAIFPDFETGRKGAFLLLKTAGYRHLALGQAIAKYAPKTENDTEKYIDYVVSKTGIDRDFPMSKLTDGQLWSVVDAMIVHEIFRVGAIETFDKPGRRYIWRTLKDAKVRPSHLLREGKIFEWASPPEDGHPSEAPGCRCWAQAYKFWDK